MGLNFTNNVFIFLFFELDMKSNNIRPLVIEVSFIVFFWLLLFMFYIPLFVLYIPLFVFYAPLFVFCIAFFVFISPCLCLR